MPDRVTATPMPLALVAVATTPKRRAAAEAGLATLGLVVPAGPRLARSGDLVFLATGPDHGLVASGAMSGSDLERSLKAAVGEAALVADQTDARAAWRIEGPAARDCLAKGSSLDLHPRAFPMGSVAATEIALISAVIWTEDAASFTVAVTASMAESFADWLAHAVAAEHSET